MIFRYWVESRRRVKNYLKDFSSTAECTPNGWEGLQAPWLNENSERRKPYLVKILVTWWQFLISVWKCLFHPVRNYKHNSAESIRESFSGVYWKRTVEWCWRRWISDLDCTPSLSCWEKPRILGLAQVTLSKLEALRKVIRRKEDAQCKLRLQHQLSNQRMTIKKLFDKILVAAVPNLC